ncbi:CHAT domain-containing protein [Kribbella ginsengisoli]|uniref:CHAT domain-containing protein n=1 Tax=Kribbella ginsengisoli TaxID=363865 RepID=A0ABP6VMK2_9ACTN
MTGDGVPTAGRIREVQALLQQLADRVGDNPSEVLQQLSEIMPELATWTRSTALLWGLHLRAQALRFLDQLDQALEAAESGLAAAPPGSPVAALLHLEAGMSLNQADHQQRASAHLESAVDSFKCLEDGSGTAWALTHLAVSLCGLGRSEEAVPIVEEAIMHAEAADDRRILRRALTQQAVINRQRGKLADALATVQAVLSEEQHPHTRANLLLEQGNILSYAQDFMAADASYVAASVEYAAHSDLLGTANAEKALGVNDLLLGRNASGLTHLSRAVDLYRGLDNNSGLGYTLQERGLVRLALGDAPGGLEDVEESRECFEASGDTLGLTGALKAHARIYASNGDITAALETLESSLTLARKINSPLAIAGNRLLQAEIDPHVPSRGEAAAEAADLYRALDMPLGVSYALSQGARAAMKSGQASVALELARGALRSLHLARCRVADPGRRSDQDFSLRDVTAGILEVCAELGSPAAIEVAADTVVDDAPLGLRQTFETGVLTAESRAILSRIDRVRSAQGPGSKTERSLLDQLAVSLATIRQDAPPEPLTLKMLRQSHLAAAVLVVGAPTPGGRLPVVTALPDAEPGFELKHLTDEMVRDIDMIGRLGERGADWKALWSDDAQRWRHNLADLILNGALADWAMSGSASELMLVLPPVLAHLPVEAFDIDGSPLGVRVAMRRLPVAAKRQVATRVDSVIGFLDPALDWGPEREALGTTPLTSPQELRDSLANDALTVVGCHGEASPGLTGALVTTDGTVVLTAGDLLSRRSAGGVFVLEACWSGRYFGSRTGEQFSMATAALIGGAGSTIAGLYALPADPACTGRLVATVIREIRAGVTPAEALRRARAEYLADPPTRLTRPGAGPLATMPGTAPWAWAGLCAYG